MTQTLNVQEIMDVLPHRYPFLLIDKIDILEPGKKAIGYKNVTFNEEFFQGHFPGNPIMPGVLIIEAMAQAAGITVCHHANQGGAAPKNVFFMSIDGARFRKPVVPGDVLAIHVEYERDRSNVYRFKAEAYVGDTKTTEATISAMIADKE